MFFKLIILCIQLIYLIKLTASQQKVSLATPSPISIPKLDNCTQYSTSQEYWFTYTYNEQQSRYCYLYPSTNTYSFSWHTAYDSCRIRNATLLSIHTEADNYIISNPFSINNSYGGVYWIGLNSLNGRRGDYRWSDRSALGYTNYANTTDIGDPLPPLKDQGRCVSIRVLANNYPNKNQYKTVGQWFKEDCYLDHQYICQKNTIPPPPLPTPPAGGCPPDWYNADQKCIKYISTPMTFDQAQTRCSQLTNGHNLGEMVTIHTELDQDFLTAFSVGLTAPYIGMTRPTSYARWRWTDESEATFANFGYQPSIPFNSPLNCLIMVTNSTQPGSWLRVNCTEKHPFICEVYRNPDVKKGMDFLGKKCNISGFGNFTQFRESCYSIVGSPSTKLSFSEAEQHCNNMGKGAHLLSIINFYEQSFLNYFVSRKANPDLYLIGFKSKAQSDTNDTQLFEWSDGWPVFYTKWLYLEPKITSTPQDLCVAMVFNNTGYQVDLNGWWKTVNCGQPFHYICKVSKNTPPKVNDLTNGVCPKLSGNTNPTLNWVNLHKGLQYCYWFSTERGEGLESSGMQSWSDASFHCRRRNGTLASIHSEKDALFLSARLKKYTYYLASWIGLREDPEGDLLWEDGSPVDFSNWAPDERLKNNTNLNDDQGNICIELSWDMTWKSTACNGNKRNYFVCQTKKLFSKTYNGVSQYAKGNIFLSLILVIRALVTFGL